MVPAIAEKPIILIETVVSPETINGKPVRLGYSVPTAYGGTDVPLSEFGRRPVHLLGGSPEKQLELARMMNVRSADQNYCARLAVDFCKYWIPGGKAGGEYFKQIEGIKSPDAPYEAFRRSCVNIMAAWQDVLAQPKRALPETYQVALPGMVEAVAA